MTPSASSGCAEGPRPPEDVEAIERRHVADWINELPGADRPATGHNLFRGVQGFVNWLEERIIPDDVSPTREIAAVPATEDAAARPDSRGNPAGHRIVPGTSSADLCDQAILCRLFDGEQRRGEATFSGAAHHGEAAIRSALALRRLAASGLRS